MSFIFNFCNKFSKQVFTNRIDSYKGYSYQTAKSILIHSGNKIFNFNGISLKFIFKLFLLNISDISRLVEDTQLQHV